MCEIEHLGNAVHHCVAERDDRVHTAQPQSVDQIGKKLHVCLPLFYLEILNLR